MQAVVFAVLAACAVYVCAQQPAPCAAPPQFSSRLLSVRCRRSRRSWKQEPTASPKQLDSQSGKPYYVVADYFYDYVNKRKATIEQVDMSG